MTSSKRISQLARGSGLGTLALLVGASAFAQTVDPTPLDGDGDLVADEIVVTGSRIPQDPSVTAANPVISIDGGDLLRTGRVDIVDSLRDIPSLQGSLPGSLSAVAAADTEDADLGLGLVNLRSLGIERTLVLQNGRRHVAATAGQAAVDVNTIPTALLKNVEVLTGGASSIYGSDAVTGVVNFILRDADDFDGLEVDLSGGISEEGDAEEFSVSGAYGFMAADDRIRVVLGAEHTRSEEVLSSERDFAGLGLSEFVPTTPELISAFGLNPEADNTFGAGLTLPISSRLGIIALGEAGSGTSAFGNVADFAPGPFPTIGSNGVPIVQVFDGTVLRDFDAGTFFIGPFNALGGDGIAANPDEEILLPESRRLILNANGEIDLNDRVTGFVEFKYVDTDTEDSGNTNGFNDDIPISLDNPFIPAALQAQIDSLIAEGITPEIAVSRDVLDAAVPSLTDADRETVRIVAGLKGPLSDSFDYELSFNYGRSDADITFANTRLDDRYFAAIDAVVDPATGAPVCRSSLDPTAIPPVSPFPEFTGAPFSTFSPTDGTCAPISIFGLNSIEGPGADFVFVNTMDNTRTVQRSILGVISGTTENVLTLPAGPIGLVAGFEYREETSEFFPDPLNTAGLTFGAVSGGPTFPSGGSVDVFEYFGEIQVPLLADMPFAELLEVSASARFSDYDTVGNTETFGFSGRYQPIQPLTIRASYSEAIRAPNIGELFSPQQPATLGAAADPCNANFLEAGSEFRQANCLTLVGAGFDSTNFNSAFVAGFSGGNPDLMEETAETFTVGAVFTPNSGPLDGLSVTVDYYDIDIEDAIDALAPFDVASTCVDLPTLDNPFCDQITRDPTNGNITSFTSGQINLGAFETEGIDFAARYRFDLPGDLGEASLGTVGTYFIAFDETPDPTAPEAVEDTLEEFGLPEFIVSGTASWTWRDLSLGWVTRYESSQLLPGISNEDIDSNPDFSDPLRTGDSFVHDFDISYDFGDRIFGESLTIYGGVNNVGDRDPYLASLTRPASPRGRFFFAGLSFKM